MAEVEEEQQQDEGSLIPAITAIIAAAAAYAATNRAISDTVAAVDTALGITAKLGGILTKIAMRMITAQIGLARSSDEKVAMSLAALKVVPLAVDDAVQVVAMSSRGIITARQQVLRSKGRVKVSPAGKDYVDLVPGDVDDPKVLARRAAQTVRNSAVFHLGEAINDDAEVPYTYRKTWHDRGDARVRATHAFLGSPKYEYHTVDLADQFVTIEGNRLRFPGDPLAPISETAHCRCHLTLARHFERQT